MMLDVRVVQYVYFYVVLITYLDVRVVQYERHGLQETKIDYHIT